MALGWSTLLTLAVLNSYVTVCLRGAGNPLVTMCFLELS